MMRNYDIDSREEKEIKSHVYITPSIVRYLYIGHFHMSLHMLNWSYLLRVFAWSRGNHRFVRAPRSGPRLSKRRQIDFHVMMRVARVRVSQFSDNEDRIHFVS